MNKFFSMRLFRDRTVGFWMSFGAAAFEFAVAIFYLVYSVAVGLFAPSIFAVMILGALSEVLILLSDFRLFSVIPAFLFSLGLGMFIDDRANYLVMCFQGVEGIIDPTAVFEIVVALIVMMLIGTIVSIVSNFISYYKEGNHQ